MNHEIKTIDWCFSPSNKIDGADILKNWVSICREIKDELPVFETKEKEDKFSVRSKDKLLDIALSKFKEKLHIHLRSNSKEKGVDKCLDDAYDIYFKVFTTINKYMPFSNLNGSIFVLMNIKIDNGQKTFNEAIQFKKSYNNIWKRNGVKLSSDNKNLTMEFVSESEGQFLFSESFDNLKIDELIPKTKNVLADSQNSLEELMNI